ncbi:hypothetical protein [Halomonas sp. KM-1]|uniref:HEPN domain-containing protein n=1 Tax=Halomonas sp. KM-1 TaxID=590061 RepID=UPI00028839BA|nr:hypothetical protein [Halomonas sp. KM-1]
MGGLKDKHLEEQEDRYIRLADALDISWDELISLDYELSANISKDGLVYGYVVTFDKDNDKEILAKIPYLDRNLTVSLSPWALERSADDEYELGAIFDNVEYKDRFFTELENIDKLRDLNIDDPGLRELLLRQLFISIIGTLETYLSDAFINKTLSSEIYLENFVATHPEFKKQKITVSDVFTTARNMREKAKTIMVGTIYHKLPAVKEMYQQTFGIEFPDISIMQRFVTQRHDLVHRNGKTINGDMVLIDDGVIEALNSSAKQMVNSISDALQEEDTLPF